MKNLFVYTILLLLLCSCDSDLKTLLTKGDNRSWYYSNNTTNLPIYFTFYKTGQLQVSEQDIDGHLHEFSFAEDLIWKKEWFIKGDSLLYIGLYGIFFSVTIQNESTLILENQNDRIVLQAIENLESFAQQKHNHRKILIDSLYQIHYNIIVETLHSEDDYIVVSGKNTISGTEEHIRLTKQEKNVLNLQKGEILVKKKNFILLNKVATDTVLLYTYEINQNDMERHPYLIQAKYRHGMRWDKKANNIIFE